MRAMKLTTIFIALMILAGCYSPAKIVIPDQPKFKQFGIYQVEGGICMGDEDIAILYKNIGILKTYSDELRRLLTDLRDRR
jgi:hypothetical protein